MPDLSIEFCGVRAPNPFWLASAPPTNSEYQVRRAFDAGWGGAVWKTLGNPIVKLYLLVLIAVTILVALIGGAGVSFAIASAELARTRSWQWFTVAGAVGGLVTGAFAKLLGVDAFNLLIGRSPGAITGAMEGILIGTGTGLAAWLTVRSTSVRRAANRWSATG